MGYHEELSHESPLYQALEKREEAELLPVSDNRVQQKLMEAWATQQAGAGSAPLAHNELAAAWIESGMAAKYRAYAEQYPGEETDVRDAESLKQLLGELEDGADRVVH